MTAAMILAMIPVLPRWTDVVADSAQQGSMLMNVTMSRTKISYLEVYSDLDLGTVMWLFLMERAALFELMALMNPRQKLRSIYHGTHLD